VVKDGGARLEVEAMTRAERLDTEVMLLGVVELAQIDDQRRISLSARAAALDVRVLAWAVAAHEARQTRDPRHALR